MPMSPRASPIPSDRRSTALPPIAGTLPFDLEPATFVVVQTAKAVEMSTEPALMSLTSVARQSRTSRLSSREVTQSCLDRIAQWQPHLNAFMAIEAEAALKAADAADAALAKGATVAARCMACRWRTRTCITRPARW